MINIQHLANLARINIKPEQEQEYQESIQQILGFVDIVKGHDVHGQEQQRTSTDNTTREDNEIVNETDGLVQQFPEQQNGFMKSKKIL